MIRKHKKTLIFTSLLTLLPMFVGLLLRNQLPDTFATHWGFDGQPDGWSDASAAIFTMPLILLAAHWICVFFTAKDKGNRDRNIKVQQLVLWIIPILSNLCCGMMYALALGADFSVSNVMVIAMGALFAVIGNYLPKCRMNSTIGIKIPWAYTSEDNWNATHRLGGRIWLTGGIIMMLTGLIPGEAGIAAMLILLLVLCVVPVVYSYRFYKKEKAEGKPLMPFFSKADSRIFKISTAAAALILAGVLFLMFSGSIDVVLEEEYLSIKASYYDDRTIFYDVIDSVEYREGNVDGTRVMGYGSARLLLGTFENEEFGYYTRYTYTNPESCIVLRAGEQVLVLSGKNVQETQNIFAYLIEKTQ